MEIAEQVERVLLERLQQEFEHLEFVPSDYVAEGRCWHGVLKAPSGAKSIDLKCITAQFDQNYLQIACSSRLTGKHSGRFDLARPTSLDQVFSFIKEPARLLKQNLDRGGSLPFFKTVQGVYLAGKVSRNYWRNRILQFNPEGELDREYGNTLWISHGTVTSDGVPLIYTGPYFTDCTHCAVNSHGWANDHEECCPGPLSADVFFLDMAAIDSASIVFAWIDSEDCYGTAAELGYAKTRRHTKVYVAGPKEFQSFKPVYCLADGALFGCETADEAFSKLMLSPDPKKTYRRYTKHRNCDASALRAYYRDVPNIKECSRHFEWFGPVVDPWEIAKVGYACGLRKETYVGTGYANRELWFVYQFADKVGFEFWNENDARAAIDSSAYRRFDPHHPAWDAMEVWNYCPDEYHDEELEFMTGDDPIEYLDSVIDSI